MAQDTGCVVDAAQKVSAPFAASECAPAVTGKILVWLILEKQNQGPRIESPKTSDVGLGDGSAVATAVQCLLRTHMLQIPMRGELGRPCLYGSHDSRGLVGRPVRAEEDLDGHNLGHRRAVIKDCLKELGAAGPLTPARGALECIFGPTRDPVHQLDYLMHLKIDAWPDTSQRIAGSDEARLSRGTRLRISRSRGTALKLLRRQQRILSRSFPPAGRGFLPSLQTIQTRQYLQLHRAFGIREPPAGWIEYHRLRRLYLADGVCLHVRQELGRHRRLPGVQKGNTVRGWYIIEFASEAFHLEGALNLAPALHGARETEQV